jgi:hypothetical protein
VPFTFHKYDGEIPPLTAFDVNITGTPWHTGFADGVIVILTGCAGITVMEIGEAVAGLPVAQNSLDVIEQDTMSPWIGIYEKTGLFVPAFDPFTVH